MGGGGSDKEKFRNKPDPVTFMILCLNRYHMTKTYVFCATILPSNVYNVHVVPDQPLHRWLVVSSFYVSRIVSPKFQQGDN